MLNINVVIIITTFLLALAAIYILYAIIMYQGGKTSKNMELQLSTKNILEHVKVLFDSKEYVLVQLLAGEYLERVPNHVDVREYLAKAYYKDKKYNNAIKQCMIILKKNPNDIEMRRLLGDCYIKKQLYDKAIKEYEVVFDNRDNDKEVLKILAELYRHTDQIHSSIAVYNILGKLLEGNELAEMELILAELNEEAHDYPAAFEAYKLMLEILPQDVQANRKLTELYIKINNQSKAIETLLYMLSFTTETGVLQWVYETLITLYAETEEFEKAIEYSNKLLEVQGSDKFKIQNDIAMFNLKLDNYDAGIAILEELVMLSQNEYEVTVELANAYIQQKEFQKALDKYLTLLDGAGQKEAKNVCMLICELYIIWAVDMAEKDKYEESYGYLNSACEYNSINPEIYYNRALNHIAQKDFTAAAGFLNMALEYDKKKDYYPKYLLKLSEVHHVLGNFFEEKKALSDLLKIDNKNPMGLYRSGLLKIVQHDAKSAEEDFKKAIQYDPGLIPAKYNLALLYESNNKEQAMKLYMEILELDPGFMEAKNALANLSSSEY